MMVLAMLLAHLVGDYVLQWDNLALWKSRSIKGAFAHGLVLLTVTIAFALAIDSQWLPYAFLIGVSHIIVDTGQQWLKDKDVNSKRNLVLSPLARYSVDQMIHLGIIFIVLAYTGYLNVSLAYHPDFGWLSEKGMKVALGYIFLTMPAWILTEFLVSGLINGDAPNFKKATNKYIGSLERGLIATFVIVGQFSLVPLVALPRLIFERTQIAGTARAPLYIAELLVSVGFAVLIGLLLR